MRELLVAAVGCMLISALVIGCGGECISGTASYLSQALQLGPSSDLPDEFGYSANDFVLANTGTWTDSQAGVSLTLAPTTDGQVDFRVVHSGVMGTPSCGRTEAFLSVTGEFIGEDGSSVAVQGSAHSGTGTPYDYIEVGCHLNHDESSGTDTLSGTCDLTAIGLGSKTLSLTATD